MSSDPCLVQTYDESEFVRPTKVISSRCPCCGQVWRKPKNARACPRCHEVKFLSEYTTKRGMCKTCWAAKIEASRLRRDAYFHEYYETKTKTKRQLKLKAKLEARLAELNQSLQQAEG